MKYNQDINRCRGVDPRLLGQMLGYDTPVNTQYGMENGGTCQPSSRSYRQRRSDMQNGCAGMTDNSLDAACAGTPSLAMVYSPHQSFEELFSTEEALSHGTLFRKLNKPWMPGGGCR